MEESLCHTPPPRPPPSLPSPNPPPLRCDLRVFFTQRPHFCESGMCAKSASFPLITFVLLRLLLQLFCKEEKRGADVSVRAPLFPRPMPALPPQDGPSAVPRCGRLHHFALGQSQLQEGSPQPAWYLGTSVASERSTAPASGGEPRRAAVPPESRGKLSSRERFRVKIRLENTPHGVVSIWSSLNMRRLV